MFKKIIKRAIVKKRQKQKKQRDKLKPSNDMFYKIKLDIPE